MKGSRKTQRETVRVALRSGRRRPSFKEWLLRMPDVGTDEDFARVRRCPRPAKSCTGTAT